MRWWLLLRYKAAEVASSFDLREVLRKSFGFGSGDISSSLPCGDGWGP